MAKYAQLTATGLPHGVLLTIKDSTGKQVSNLYPEANANAPDNRPRFADGTGAIDPAAYVPNGTYTVAYSGGSQTVVVSGASGTPADSMFIDLATQAELDAAGTAASGTYVSHAPAPSGGDDTAVIQALLNSADQVILDSGLYSVTALTIPTGKTLRGTVSRRYTGAPVAGSRLLCSSAAQTTPIITMNGNATLDGVAVSGTGSGNHACVFFAANNNTVRNCVLRRGSHGIDGNYTNVHLITGCGIYENLQNGIQTVIDSLVQGNWVNVNSSDGIYLGPGCNDNVLQANKFEFNVRNNVSIFQASHNSVNSNVIDRCGQAGVKLDQANRTTVIGNTLRRNGSAQAGTPGSAQDCHVYLVSSTGCVISGNVTEAGANDDLSGYTSPTNCLYLSAVTHSRITGNNLLGCTGATANDAGGHTNLVRLLDASTDVETGPFPLLTGATFTGAITAPSVGVPGQTGATNAGRFVGVTTTLAPTTGTWLVGDFVLTQNGQMFVCVTAGTPGTWVNPRDLTNLLTTGEETIPRINCLSGIGMSSQRLHLSYFTARKTETVTTVKVQTQGTAAAATPTLCRVGVYSVAANGDLTLVASIANDTTMFASTFTTYQRTLTASLSKVAGARYAVGVLVVSAAAMPNFYGASGSDATVSPLLAGTVTGQADLPASLTAASVTTSSAPQYAVLAP